MFSPRSAAAESAAVTAPAEPSGDAAPVTVLLEALNSAMTAFIYMDVRVGTLMRSIGYLEPWTLHAQEKHRSVLPLPPSPPSSRVWQCPARGGLPMR